MLDTNKGPVDLYLDVYMSRSSSARRSAELDVGLPLRVLKGRFPSQRLNFAHHQSIFPEGHPPKTLLRLPIPIPTAMFSARNTLALAFQNFILRALTVDGVRYCSENNLKREDARVLPTEARRILRLQLVGEEHAMHLQEKWTSG